MTNDREDPLFPDEPKSMLQKLLPPLILMTAFGGFVALAIYAYKAGTQSVKEGDLMVVEAEATPMKEKPEDPGGMQFPNQDKTIFETFAASGGQAPPNVERVLPTPEEPMSKEMDTSGTTTWVNDKLAGNAPVAAAPAAVEQVFSENATPATPTALTDAVAEKAAASTAETKVVNIQEELGKQAVAEADTATAAAVELQPAPDSAAKEAFNPPKKEVPTPAKETVKKADVKKPETKKPITSAKPSSGKQLVQLGAYKEEAAARADFAKLQKRFGVLAGKSPTINRADLGDKGVFYRLRVATEDGKKLCASLVGQACMVVK